MTMMGIVDPVEPCHVYHASILKLLNVFGDQAKSPYLLTGSVGTEDGFGKNGHITLR